MVEVTTVAGFEGANMLEDEEKEEGRGVSLSPLTESSEEASLELTLQSFQVL